MFLKQLANLRELKVLKMGFYKQTPGNFPSSGRKCLTGWGTGAVGSSQTNQRLANLGAGEFRY